jgi:CRISPR/Cas system-associated endonuclease Cas1
MSVAAIIVYVYYTEQAKHQVITVFGTDVSLDAVSAVAFRRKLVRVCSRNRNTLGRFSSPSSAPRCRRLRR